MTDPLLLPVMIKMRWTIHLKALAVKLIGSSFMKQQIVAKSFIHALLFLQLYNCNFAIENEML